MKTKLVLIRHGESLWNKENRFTGLTDIRLSENGIRQARHAAEKLNKSGIKVEIAFTSELSRASTTADIIVGQQDDSYWRDIYNQASVNNLSDNNENKTSKPAVYKNANLNERDYGFLTGKNKTETIEEYGEQQVHKWRRGYLDRPPSGENLEDVYNRVSSYYNFEIKPHLEERNVLIAAHGNSLRALFIALGIFDKTSIERFEIPTGQPFVVTFTDGEITEYGYLSNMKFRGREILDSRGNPTVEVDVFHNHKVVARDSCPSGASTGTNEARELRDGEARYGGKGVTHAVANVNKFSDTEFLEEIDILNLINFDKKLCKRDGTQLKEKLGGNATTALSFAAASAGAKLADKQLFQHFCKTYFSKNKDDDFRWYYGLPTPMVNILNGGKHAGGNLKIQEFMIMPREDIDFRTKMEYVTKVYHTLGKILVQKHGLSAKNLGDEGGFAPQLNTPNEALTIIQEAITESGFQAGTDIFLALDCAASEYYDRETKRYEIQTGMFLDKYELCSYYKDLLEEFPALKSIEDPFDEYDYEGWSVFMKEVVGRMDRKLMVVGDDLYTTNSETVKKGIENNWANSLLLKVNQIGTITEAVDAAKLMFDADMDVIVSHRSGETSSTLISDLAVGIGAKYIKTGAPARGERVTKYNRLLQIEEFLKENSM